MSRRQHEQEHMDRLRAARGLPPLRRDNIDRLMERTRAAVAFVNTGVSEATKLHGFMALFHPEVPEETVRELARDMRRDRRR